MNKAPGMNRAQLVESAAQAAMAAPILVESERDLAHALVQCSRSDAVAVDTEFMRTDTFYPILGLVQLCDGNNTWLVDPVSVKDLSPLAELLAAPGITKIFHSCSEDLEVLQHALQVIPAPLFDTQIAASFAGQGFSTGYANLVNAVLGTELDKHETRSDWLQRPLSASQCRYAAEDVHYLMQVYRRLQLLLEENGRLRWVEEDMQSLVDAAATAASVDTYYQRIKGAWRLEARALAVLQALAAWREEEARRRDKPRNRIIHDRVLLEIAAESPASRQQLAAVADLHPGAQRRYGEKLLDLVAMVDGLSVDNYPPPLPAPLPRDARKQLDKFRQAIRQRAEQLQMPAEVFARKKDLEELVRSLLAGDPRLPGGLARGWRYEQAGRQLESMFKEER